MRAAAALLALAFTGAALGADAVTVSALRDPVVKSYRKMAKGAAVFEELHAMAPSAALRFRLWPRKADTPMERISLALVADSFERPIPVAADRTFALPADPRGLQENASVRPNRKSGTLTWRAEIRTPGLPADTRRLGDLRLECRVGMAAGLVSHYPSLFERFMDFVLGGAAFCEQRVPPYLFFADGPLYAVTLVDGARRQTLSMRELYAGILEGGAPKEELSYCDCAALLDRAYFVPLGDARWSDDTRIELEYMDDTAASDANGYSALVGSTKAEMRAIFGEARVLRFDRERELWVYEIGGGGKRDEIVALFGADERVRKARLRLAP